MRGTSTLNPSLPRGHWDTRKKAPRLVIGVQNELASAIDSHFQTLGWEVTMARSGTDAAHLARRKRATAVILSTESTTESGLLTCAKMSLVRPHPRVVLVGPEQARLMRYARYAGAVGYLPEGAGVAAVARAVLGT